MWARRDDSLWRVAVLGYSDIVVALHRLPGLLAPPRRHEAGSGLRGARVGDLTYLAVVWWAGVVISSIFYGFSVPLTHLLDASNQYNNSGFFNENEMPINGLHITLLHSGFLAWASCLAGSGLRQASVPHRPLSSARLLGAGWLNCWMLWARSSAAEDKLTKTAAVAIIAICATLSVVLDVVVSGTLNVKESSSMRMVLRLHGGTQLFAHTCAGKTIAVDVVVKKASSYYMKEFRDSSIFGYKC